MVPGRITLIAAIFGTVVATALAPAAFADNVVSQVIDSNGAGVGGIRDVALGESTSVSYWIDANGSDGCDAADGSAANVEIVVPPEVNASPASLTFTICGTHDSNTKSVSFSSNTPGTYEVAVHVEDTAGTYNESPATFKLRVGGSGGETGSPCDGVVAPAAPTITSTPSAPNGLNGWFVTTAPTLAASSATSGAVISWSTDGAIWTADAPQLGEGITNVSARAESLGLGGVSCGAFSSVTSSTFKVDTVSPILTITGSESGPFNVCASLPTRPTFTATDDPPGSGLDGTEGDSWSVPGTASGVGTYTYSAHAKDLAGNTTTESRTYTVTYGAALNAFLQPINQDGSSRFKLGSTIPVKFTALCGAVPLSTVVAKMFVAKGDSVADPGVDEAVSTAAATTGNLFRYDPTGAQYIFNLSTKLGYLNPGATTATSFTPGTWTLKIGLDDGTWRSVNVQLVK